MVIFACKRKRIKSRLTDGLKKLTFYLALNRPESLRMLSLLPLVGPEHVYQLATFPSVTGKIIINVLKYQQHLGRASNRLVASDQSCGVIGALTQKE